MVIILAVLIAFVVPVLFVLRREWKLKKAEDAKQGAAAKKKEPVSPQALFKTTVAVLFILLPAIYFSDTSYSFYSPQNSAVKVAFKHTGKRIADCGEADLFRSEGERYRKELKDTRQVKMNIEKLANCPRERHPVVLELYMDGKEMLKKAYPPTGIKSDMASYIYDEFVIEPGVHKFEARLYDKGAKDAPDYTIEQVVTVAPKEVKVIRVDDKLNKFVIE